MINMDDQRIVHDLARMTVWPAGLDDAPAPSDGAAEVFDRRAAQIEMRNRGNFVPIAVT